MRLTEALRLRVKDIDFELMSLTVRGGRRETDRTTMLPTNFAAPVQVHLECVRALHSKDVSNGSGEAWLP